MMDEELIKKNRQIFQRINSLVGLSEGRITKKSHPEAWKLQEQLKIPNGFKGALHFARVLDSVTPSAEDVLVEVVSSPRHESSKFDVNQIYAYKGLCNRLLEGAEGLLRSFQEATGHQGLTLDEALELARGFADPRPVSKGSVVKGLLPPASPQTKALGKGSTKKKGGVLNARYRIMLRIIGDNEPTPKEVWEKSHLKPYSEWFVKEGFKLNRNNLYNQIAYLKSLGAIAKLPSGGFIVTPAFKPQMYKG